RKPVFVLTSPRTFSAAEGLAYAIQTFKRGVIVGETTGGGANPSAGGGAVPLGRGVVANVPTGYVGNPGTGTNLGGVGGKRGWGSPRRAGFGPGVVAGGGPSEGKRDRPAGSGLPGGALAGEAGWCAWPLPRSDRGPIRPERRSGCHRRRTRDDHGEGRRALSA